MRPGQSYPPICILLLTAVALFGQNPQPEPSFEVAAIKVNNSGSKESSGDISNGRLTIRNVTLRFLIAESWSLTVDDISGPPWLDEIRVDVVAKAPSAQTPDSELRRMGQTLLKERMKLVMHMEQREQSVWALSVAAGKPNLTASTMPVKPEDAVCHSTPDGATIRFACQHTTMEVFARDLPKVEGRYIDRRVVDRTGLQGAWDFAVQWTPPAQIESDGGLTLFAALRAQLGLKMDSEKLPVPIVVVDSMARTPSEN